MQVVKMTSMAVQHVVQGQKRIKDGSTYVGWLWSGGIKIAIVFLRGEIAFR